MKGFLTTEEGQGLVEYALILVLVSIVVIAILLVLGPVVGNVFSNVVAVLQAAGMGGGGQVVTIEEFEVTGQYLGYPTNGCKVTCDELEVKVTEDGAPVEGVSVSGTVSVQGGGGIPVSGTTLADGKVKWSSFVIGTDPDSSCDGSRIATASVGGDTATASY